MDILSEILGFFLWCLILQSCYTTHCLERVESNKTTKYMHPDGK